VSTPEIGDGNAPPPLTVGVVGAGTMGSGIAQAALTAGHSVLLHDADPAATRRGVERITAALDRMVEKGRLDRHASEDALERLRSVDQLSGLARDSDLIVEAALEDLGVKHAIFRALDMDAHPEVVLASNTSSLSIEAIAAAAHHRERIIGLHFFNPAPVMPLVEVVAAADSSRAAITLGASFATGLGKTTVVCADAPGFIVNRVNRGFTLEPLRMLEAGEAGIEQIDAAIEAAGYPMGPFRLMDLVGIDVNYAVARSLFEAFDEALRFRPSPIQARMVDTG
jgi:3-hydroxybutyryl-CoA dehydrogenase